MAAFDVLNIFEQTLLKCASVLGYSFDRIFLLSVLKFPSEVFVASAIRRLFNFKIIECSTRREAVKSSAGEYDLECMCTVHECEIESYPHYSFCQHLRFKFPAFCDTIYELTAPSQRKDFHARAVLYLEEDSIQCSACVEREVKLVKLSTKKQRSNFDDDEKVKFKMSSDNNGEIGITDVETRPHYNVETSPQNNVETGPQNNVETRPRNNVEIGPQNNVEIRPQNNVEIRPQNNVEIRPQNNVETGPQNNDETSPQYNVEVGSKISQESFKSFIRDFQGCLLCCNQSKKLKKARVRKLNEDKIILNHLNEIGLSFEECTCYDILIKHYRSLIHHCKASDNEEKTLQHLVEFGKTAIFYGHNREAVDLFRDAEELLKKVEAECDEMVFRLQMQRVLAFLGEAYLNLGMINNAADSLASAFELVRTRGYKFLDLFFNKWPFTPHKVNLKLRKTFSTNADTYVVMSYIFMENNYLVKAEQMSRAGLKNAIQSKNLVAVGENFATLIDITQYHGHSKRVEKISKKALKLCLPLYKSGKKIEVLTFAKLIAAIFKARLLHGRLNRALEIVGHLRYHIKILKAPKVSQVMSPLIYEVYTCTKHFDQILDFLRDKKPSPHDPFYKRKYFHYTQKCLKLYIRTGLSFYEGGSMEDAVKILEGNINYLKKGSENPLTQHTLVCIWLWHLRRREFNTAKQRSMEAVGTQIVQSSLNSFLLHLECNLLCLVHLIEKNATTKEIVYFNYQRVKSMTLVCKVAMKHLYPRALILQAYFYAIVRRKTLCIRSLNQAQVHAEAQRNLFDKEGVIFMKSIWFGKRGTYRKALKQYNMNAKTHVDRLSASDLEAVHFPLPLPHKKRTNIEVSKLISDTALFGQKKYTTLFQTRPRQGKRRHASLEKSA